MLKQLSIASFLMASLSTNAITNDDLSLEMGSDIESSRIQKTQVTCESWDFNPQICEVSDVIVDGKLVQQLSDKACVEGENYEIGEFEVEVRDGCRGVFSVSIDASKRIRRQSCSSEDFAEETCNVRGKIDYAWVFTRLSKSRCIENVSWGYQGNAIWVKDGCRAVFAYTKK